MNAESKGRGRWAIVTGAAGGIGFEFASRLYSTGWSVLMLDLAEERLEEASRKLRENQPEGKIERREVETAVIDLSDSYVAEKVDAICRIKEIVPTVLVNNAGIFSFAPMTETSEKKIRLFLDLHVRAVTLLSRWFCGLPAKEGEKRWLLNMSSMSCWMPMPGLAMYASTKAYIRVFSRSLHYEMREDGVSVMVACPGGISTDLFGLPDNLKKLAVGIRVLDTPEKFVKKALKKLFRGKKQYINGMLNRFSIFFVGVTPTPVRMMVKHRLLDKGIKR